MGLSVDASRWRGRIDAVTRALPAAARDAAVAGGRAFVEWMDMYARRDTNRYVRGWQTAFNDIGVGEPVRVSRVVNSRKNDVYLAVLEKEEARARRELLFRQERLKKRLGYTKGKVGRSERREMAIIKKLDTRITRIDEEIQKAQGATGLLFFDMYRGKRSFSTVRTRVYGGRGAVDVTDGRAVLVLRNLEPHAAILEKRYGFVRAAADGARGQGLRRASNAHARRIARADPLFRRVLAGDFD